MRQKPDLSLIVPVYNEEKRIEKGLKQILNYLKKQQFSWELIIVDDGSQDDTEAVARQILRRKSDVRVISEPHTGKGGAIKSGVLRAKGKWVVFLDIDLATPMEELEKFMRFQADYDVIIGSRKMKGANILVHQPKFREFGGRMFTLLTNLLVTRGISDITCGFKMFKTSLAKELFQKSLLTDWSFDAEILFLAQREGAQVKEIPVSWRDDPDTKVSLFRDTVAAFVGLLKIRLFELTGKYD